MTMNLKDHPTLQGALDQFAQHFNKPVKTHKTVDTGCRARRQQDQMACGFCGLQWDLGDPSPPACNNTGTQP